MNTLVRGIECEVGRPDLLVRFEQSPPRLLRNAVGIIDRSELAFQPKPAAIGGERSHDVDRPTLALDGDLKHVWRKGFGLKGEFAEKAAEHLRSGRGRRQWTDQWFGLSRGRDRQNR